MEQSSDLIHFIINKVIGKYMIDCMDVKGKNVCYPVVVGGSTISSVCIDPKNKLYISDIDIVFVPKSKHPDTIEKTDNNRITFLTKILEDVDLQHYIKSNGLPQLSIDYIYKRKPDYKRIVAIKLVRLRMENRVVLDTSIHHTGVNRFLGKYPVKGVTKSTPIPYVKKQNILWATCEYIKMDTIRVILFYNKSLINEENHFNLKTTRLLKYLKKICLLLKISNKSLDEYFDSDEKLNTGDLNVIFKILDGYTKFYKLKEKLLIALPNASDEVIII